MLEQVNLGHHRNPRGPVCIVGNEELHKIKQVNYCSSWTCSCIVLFYSTTCFTHPFTCIHASTSFFIPNIHTVTLGWTQPDVQYIAQGYFGMQPWIKPPSFLPPSLVIRSPCQASTHLPFYVHKLSVSVLYSLCSSGPDHRAVYLVVLCFVCVSPAKCDSRHPPLQELKQKSRACGFCQLDSVWAFDDAFQFQPAKLKQMSLQKLKCWRWQTGTAKSDNRLGLSLLVDAFRSIHLCIAIKNIMSCFQ